MPITGNTLIAWGHKPGAWFKEAIAAAEAARRTGADEIALRAIVARFAPPPIETVGLHAHGTLAHHMNIRADEPEEAENVAAVERHMAELMRVPTVVAGAVMPDACPAGAAPGTIPVGGVVAARNAIHPGMHSADICCSMAVSVLTRDADPTAILDAGMKLSHFGAGGRDYSHDMRPSADLLGEFERNRYLALTTDAAVRHFGTQGDGNHFFFVGRVASTEQIAIVTHHGSRKPGALLYKAGMEIAERMTRERSPETPKHNAWIPADTPEGETYWAALQLVRRWTKGNHFAIHDTVVRHLGLKVKDRFWNEHNFVFLRDGLYFHAKGATPAWRGFARDDSGLTLIPLNMAEPILVTRGRDAPNGLGFAPHGAGRNFSRSAFLRRNAGKTESQIVAEQTRGIDARFYCGIPDVSELPGAYKPAATVRRQIDEYGLAEVVDTIEPLGSIMAGDWQRDAPWRKKKQAKLAVKG
jgi:tRNA-splicing ligase RtcB